MDNNIIIPPLRHRHIEIDGKKVTGRPIEYATKSVTKDMRDISGQYIVATVFETMCPHCCLRMTFKGDVVEARCPHCKRGWDKYEKDPFPFPFCEPGEFDFGLQPLSAEKQVK